LSLQTVEDALPPAMLASPPRSVLLSRRLCPRLLLSSQPSLAMSVWRRFVTPATAANIVQRLDMLLAVRDAVSAAARHAFARVAEVECLREHASYPSIEAADWDVVRALQVDANRAVLFVDGAPGVPVDALAAVPAPNSFDEAATATARLFGGVPVAVEPFDEQLVACVPVHVLTSFLHVGASVEVTRPTVPWWTPAHDPFLLAAVYLLGFRSVDNVRADDRFLFSQSLLREVEALARSAPPEDDEAETARVAAVSGAVDDRCS
jgi:hypothetical protein